LNSLRILTLLSLICVSQLAGARCIAEKIIEHEFERSTLNILYLNALAGSLDITGHNTDKIVFRGKACADALHFLDRINLDIVAEDSELTLTAIIPYNDDDFDTAYAYMDIELSLPEDLTIAIKDSSGNISIEDAQISLIDDNSGEIDVRDSSGDLVIKDSSGDINIRDHRGHITLTDSSGDIDLSGITGDVTIPGDSAGEIDIDTVSGFVRIDNDSSGDIEIESVGKDVTIGNDGSGRVRVAHVGGDFILESKGSGNVKTREVQGIVYLPRNKTF